MLSAFSFSAPRFSDEDELREKESLPAEQQLQIANDLFGGVQQETVAQVVVQNAFVSFHDELEQIPDDLKQSFLQARQEAPELVEREANPMLFLRAEKYEPQVRRVGLIWHTSRFELYYTVMDYFFYG
jgi:hypothetical protein